jgi:hypothetical protein
VAGQLVCHLASAAFFCVAAFLIFPEDDLAVAVLFADAFVTLVADLVARPEANFFITEPKSHVCENMNQMHALWSAEKEAIKSLFTFKILL